MNTVQKQRLYPPQSHTIQRQTSEVGALQYETIYELAEQKGETTDKVQMLDLHCTVHEVT